MITDTELPQPSPEAIAHSARLVATIRRRVAAAGGSIGFDEYMHAALYEPGLGYYLGGTIKFGREGDFITAPQRSSLFGFCLARQCAEVLNHTGGDIVEFGAGSGALAATVLVELEHDGALPDRYLIIELSPALREQQRETIARVAPAALDRVHWVDAPPQAFSGVVVANEVIDALPVKRFRLSQDTLFERRVSADEKQFIWHDVVANGAWTRDLEKILSDLGSGTSASYESEFNVSVSPWVSDLARIMGHGVALIVDYGYPQHEYYHPDRADGSLRCYFRHRLHGDPFWYPGLQDITASVNFTQVAEAALAADLHVSGFTTQTSFLMATGLLAEAERRMQAGDERQCARIAHETKILTLPTEMGTQFKVMALSSRYNHQLTGFDVRDERHRL